MRAFTRACLLSSCLTALLWCSTGHAAPKAQPTDLPPPQALQVPQAGIFNPITWTLANGLRVVLIPNHRAPIISHMVWYQVGAADEPQGKGGIAHLLEHLMFKGTPSVGDGLFSRRVAAQGGNDNAFTSWDFTAYFQNIAKDQLPMVMEMEADRMVNLTLTEDQVTSERGVVAAERQQTTDNEPADRLREAMRAALFVHHPYGRPIVGWGDEIKGLTRDDALNFYRTWYSPANAIVVIAGDVTADDVRPLVEKTYGAVPTRPAPERKRLVEPTLDTERRVILRDAGTQQPVIMRSYLAPSYRAGQREDALPLQVLSEVLSGGTTSRLYKTLVLEKKIATAVQFSYDPTAFDLSTADIGLSPAPTKTVEQAEAALDEALAAFLKQGLSEAELKDAQKRMIDSATFSRDSMQSPAYIFGMTLSTGGTIEDVETWPQRVMAVTTADVMRAAHALLEQKSFVTGLLLPSPLAAKDKP